MRNHGVTTDPLFVGITRPPMKWGVTFPALLCNMVLTLEFFLLTKNLLVLLLAVPIHGVSMLLCARDARFFDLFMMWGRTRIPAWFTTLRYWHASSHSPLALNLPSRPTRRRSSVTVHY